MEWPRQPYIGYPVTVSAISDEGEASSMSAAGFSEMRANVSSAAAWPAANKAYYIPVYVTGHVAISSMMWRNGATINGNVDVGIYSRDGTRLVSSGSVAHSGVSVIQSTALSITLTPELYFLALASSSATATFYRFTYGATLGPMLTQSVGLRASSSSFNLPASAVTAGWSGTAAGLGDYFPFLAATGRTLI